jgi:ubiquinol-cytochrome c reductase cytochrome b subunit
VPKPDYFFQWLYALLALLPPQMETVLLIVGPVVILGWLILLPFFAGRRREKLEAASDRSVTIALTAVRLAP